jgi:4-amino-4-deoxychorismate lyase
VLARAEWLPGEADEGLMRDADGYVVCATSANVFVLREGRWWTPPVDRCGIAGVCRSWVVRALAAGERRLAVEDVETADAVILSNAVRGILPVSRVGEVALAPHPAVADARRRLALAHPAFAAAPAGRP